MMRVILVPLFLLAACQDAPPSAPGPDPTPIGQKAGPDAEKAVEPDPPAPPAAADPAPAQKPAQETARRCGWLHNPTPANWWLEDRHGMWVLGTQGAYQAPGMDEMPDMSVAGWVETNVHYGYGCACMTLTVDTDSKKVLRIANAEPKPLKQCSNDKTLPDPMADAVGD